LKCQGDRTKKKILKTSRKKSQVTYKSETIRITAYLSAETPKTRRERPDVFQALKQN
jgi:hypothetical protein